MRPLLIAVLLLSCVSDESRRAARTPTATPAPASPSVQAPPVILAERASMAQPVVVADRAPAAVPVDPRSATRQAAHDVLAEHCGECHEGHRSTAPKALAVFDLDQPDWPTRFDEHRFASALRRLEKKPEAARAAFVAFRDAELATTTAATTAAATN